MARKFAEKDFVRIYHGSRNKTIQKEKMQILQSEYDRINQSLRPKNLDKHEPFEYFEVSTRSILPIYRLPAPGIRTLPLTYHKQ